MTIKSIPHDVIFSNLVFILKVKTIGLNQSYYYKISYSSSSSSVASLLNYAHMLFDFVQ